MWMWLLPGWGRRLAGTALLGRWAQNGNQCGVHHSSNTDRCLEGDGEQTGPLPHGLEEDPLSAPSRVSWREKRPESGRPASEGEGLGSGDRGNREKRLEREDSRDAEPISTGCGRREGRCPGSRLGRGGRRADPGAEGGGHRAVLGGVREMRRSETPWSCGLDMTVRREGPPGRPLLLAERPGQSRVAWAGLEPGRAGR